jgi:hypothetical protein
VNGLEGLISTPVIISGRGDLMTKIPISSLSGLLFLGFCWVLLLFAFTARANKEVGEKKGGQKKTKTKRKNEGVRKRCASERGDE